MSQSPILLNDFRALWSDIRASALDAVDRVGQSGWLILGDEVSAFESELAAFSQIPHCVGVANGLDAIEIGLRALGLRPGERVLTTPLSAFATSLAILRAGGEPVFVDTDDNGLLDLEAAQRYLSSHRDVRFMVPVHLFGHTVDLKKLAMLRDEFSLLIVEDCAQAIGARSHGIPVGQVGQVAATSFYPTKNLGCFGDGGALLTANDEIASVARSLRDYGQSKKYVHDRLGLNSRLDELQAAILRSALLPKLGKFTEIRRAVATKLIHGIRHPQIRVVREHSESFSVWHLFPVRVLGSRESLQSHLKSHGILSGIHYPIIIPQQRALEHLACAKESFPKAREMANSELSLPIHPYLKPEELEVIVSACNSWKES